MSNSLQSQHARLTVLHYLLEFAQIHIHWRSCHLTISSSVAPFSFAFHLSQHQGLFQWLIRWPKSWSFSFSISPSNEYSGLISFRIDLVWSPGSPRESQESSAAPQFESIGSSALGLLYGPTLTTLHVCPKNHSFDYMELCWQNDVSAF